MTIIVETGNLEAGANSYVSVADVDAYFLGLGTAWDGYDNTTKETAILNAAKYLERLYGRRFISFPRDPNQSMLWPRMATYDTFGKWRKDDIIAQEIKDAQCEMSLMYLDDPTSMYPDYDNTASYRQYDVQVGDVAKRITYGGTVNSPMYSGYRKIDVILEALIDDGVNGVQFSL